MKLTIEWAVEICLGLIAIGPFPQADRVSLMSVLGSSLVRWIGDHPHGDERTQGLIDKAVDTWDRWYGAKGLYELYLSLYPPQEVGHWRRKVHAEGCAASGMRARRANTEKADDTFILFSYDLYSLSTRRRRGPRSWKLIKLTFGSVFA